MLIVFICAYGNLLGQEAAISGTVEASGIGLAGATVSLLKAEDSSWIKSAFTDDNGLFVFKAVSQGSYLITATSVGYESGTTSLTIKDNGEQKCTIPLQKQSKALEGVTVAAKKPFIEMSLGKTVVNIEGTTTTACSNVLDLMRRLPGISVDMNGAISMQGKQGVLVLIDDRPTYLSGDELAAYLKTITADEAAQIELITQPGAKYDASGDNGIINIKLKKNKKQGWNGTVTLLYGQGVYFHRDESFLISYKKNKLNLSLSASDMEAIGFADWQENRFYLDAQTGATTSTSLIHSGPKEIFTNTALRLNADYDLTDKTTIGVNARATYHSNSDQVPIFSTNNDLASNTLTYNNIASHEGFVRNDVVANAYLSHKFSKESTLDVNFDCLIFNKNTYQNLTNTTYDGQMNPLPDPLILRSSQPETIKVYSIKADQTYAFKNGIKMEAGLKSSWETTDFNANVGLYENSNWVNDTGFSNHFLYRENINSAYISASKTLGKKWEAHCGLRAEQTNTEAIQYIQNDRLSRSYISLFPTAYLTYKEDSSNEFELNYGRRIDRPGYQQLNPFVYYSFENNYTVGNPYLQPQFTNNIELKHSYKNMLNTTLSFSRTTDVITDAYVVNDTTEAVYNTTNNLATNNYVTLSVIFNKQLYKWWQLNLSGSAYYASYTGVVNDKSVSAKFGSYSLNMNTQLDLGKDWKAEAYVGYYCGGQASLITSNDPNIYMEFGASKKINKRLLIKADFSDPFNMYRMGIHTFMDNYHSDAKFRYASQLFSFSLTYNFGSSQTKERKADTTDEAKRMKLD